MPFILNSLPNDQLHQIFSFVHSSTHLELSLIDKKIKSVLDKMRASLSIRPFHHCITWSQHESLGLPLTTLTSIVKRFENIQLLSLDGFHEYHECILKPLFQFLRCERPKRLKYLKISEIELMSCPSSSKAGELTKELFECVSSPQNLSLEITTSLPSRRIDNKKMSVITGEMINSIFRNSVNLVSFTFLSLFSQSTKLDHFQPNPKLKYLDLNNGNCLENDERLDAATKPLRDLEFFSCVIIDEYRVTNTGLIQLSKNCPNLTTLRFDFKNITDEGCNFVMNTGRLTKLHALHMHQITEKGILTIIQNCPNLTDLKMTHVILLTKAIFSSLINCCEKLRSLSISCKGYEISEQDREQFHKSSKSSRYLEIELER